MKPFLLFLFFAGAFHSASAQQRATLTVEKIMRDPKWMGTSPQRVEWDALSNELYFRWNPEAAEYASLYKVDKKQNQVEKMEEKVSSLLVQDVVFDKKRERLVFERDGDLYLRNLKTPEEIQLTQTSDQESDPKFSADGSFLIFRRGDNLYCINLETMALQQLTNFTKKQSAEKQENEKNEQQAWLKQQQLELFDVLQQEQREKAVNDSLSKLSEPEKLRELPIASGEVLRSVNASPDLRYISYLTYKPAKGNKPTLVPEFVTESGYTEELNTRTKVGDQPVLVTAYLYDRERDSVYTINAGGLEGIKDIPTFYDDYPEKRAALEAENDDRRVSISTIDWSPSGQYAVAVVTALDHKDRWICKVDLVSGELSVLDRQHDDAWIAGPGIGGSRGGGTTGWIDEEHFYFQSEVTGYSHLYRVAVGSGEKKQLTSGNFEVQRVHFSKDKKHFYVTANKKHPGITHLYRLPVEGGEMEQLTDLDGGNEVTLSPDEKWFAIRHSTSNTPWELYLQENKANAKPIKLTSSQTEEFQAYNWRKPEVISFKNRHGIELYARLYQPDQPKAEQPAVVFVHGAGYLQNAHEWWSSYFREYMFHNLLVDLGYTVLDIDYTGSAGYGRDHRTGIYRHMGGKDLSDQVDGVKLLVDKYGVNPKNVGLYGGSYGGFITLMAMFNEPDVFAAGAGLRSVTDWAHYNHGYTSNILNEPFTDPKAYERSSPINFASGLKGHLLMCHGMVDVNVHFQDIVRLSQRLIELGKDNWELAVYPVEDHGFTKASSWTDEYKRILKLFEEKLAN